MFTVSVGTDGKILERSSTTSGGILIPALLAKIHYDKNNLFHFSSVNNLRLQKMS